MTRALHADPTFEAVVRMEVREKRCGCCRRSNQVMPGVFVCRVNKQWPRCRRERKGFVYDDGS